MGDHPQGWGLGSGGGVFNQGQMGPKVPPQVLKQLSTSVGTEGNCMLDPCQKIRPMRCGRSFCGCMSTCAHVCIGSEGNRRQGGRWSGPGSHMDMCGLQGEVRSVASGVFGKRVGLERWVKLR